LAHGSVLRDRFYDGPMVQKIATDHRDAGLDALDIAVMDFAEKVAGDASKITAADVDALRRHGLSDVDIFQIVLAAAARCFFSTAIDAVGAEPDAHFRTAMETDVGQALTFGRPIADQPDDPAVTRSGPPPGR
jgi:hypothetical protein